MAEPRSRFVVVSPNPAIDVTYTVPEQLVGATVRVDSVERRPGGKGVNVARVLLALGHDPLAVQTLGGDAGRWMRGALATAGLRESSIETAGETRTTLAVVDGRSHPTLYAEPGAAVGVTEWQRLVDVVGETAEDGGWVVVAGSFPPGVGDGELRLLVATARSAGARILVDTSGPLLLVAAEAGADVVKCNAQEAADATGQASPADAIRVLGDRGSIVVVSLGARGLQARSPDGAVVEQAAVPGIDGNPTGAGDAATAGLVAELATGGSLGAALRQAALCGAAAVLHPVAGEISPEVLPELGARVDALVGPPSGPPHPLPAESAGAPRTSTRTDP